MSDPAYEIPNTIRLQGRYTEDLFLTSDNVYLLEGNVIIGDSEVGVTTNLDSDPVVATLHIEPGTVIVASLNSKLIIENGSKINATGNINEPIIFTTGKDYLDGLNQDIKFVHDLSNDYSNWSFHTWDGISIHGAAPVYMAPHFSDWPTNPSYWAEIWAPYVDETFSTVENGKHPFLIGGNNKLDDSGSLEFVQIKNASTALTLAGVGSETELNNIQIISSGTGIRIDGGTAEINKLIYTGGTSLEATGVLSDSGWSGTLQNAIIDLNTPYDSPENIIGVHHVGVKHNPEVFQAFNGQYGNSSADNMMEEAFGKPLILNSTILGSEKADNSLAILVRDENAEGISSSYNKLSLINNVIVTDDIKITPTYYNTNGIPKALNHIKGNFFPNSRIEIDYEGNTWQVIADASGQNTGDINAWNNFTSKEFSLNDSFLPSSNVEEDVLNIAKSMYELEWPYQWLSEDLKNAEFSQTNDGEFYAGAINRNDNWLDGAGWTSGLDTSPPQLEITEVSIEYTGSGNYWKFTGDISDASPINDLSISIKMGDETNLYSIPSEAIEPNGSFTFSGEIPSSIQNTLRADIIVESVNIIDAAGNHTIFSPEQITQVNALIINEDYFESPPPLLEMTEVNIEYTNSGNFWKFTGKISDPFHDYDLSISIKMGDETELYSIPIEDVGPDGSFTLSAEIPSVTPSTFGADIAIESVRIIDDSGYPTIFSPEQITQVNTLIPNEGYAPLLEITEIDIEYTDEGNYWKFTGNTSNTSSINDISISIKMGDETDLYIIPSEAIEPDGSFTFSSEISSALPSALRTEIAVESVSIKYDADNQTTFSTDLIAQVNTLIPNEGYVETTPPQLEMTEVIIENTDSGNFWKFTGDISDASPINNFSISIKMGDETNLYSIPSEAIEPDGSFTFRSEIPSSIQNTSRADIIVESVSIIDAAGNQTTFSPEQIAEINSLIPNEDYEYLPGAIVLTGRFTEDVYLTKDNVYLINDSLIIGDANNGISASLNIEPGTIITATNSGSIIIEQDSKINASGEIDNPIIFTTVKDYVAGLSDDIYFIHEVRVDDGGVNYSTEDLWGGIEIHGNAPVYDSGNILSWTNNPGLIKSFGDFDIGKPVSDIQFLVGGSDSIDSSGSLEFAQIKNAFNALNLSGVGSETNINNVQIISSATGVELMGGSVDINKVIYTGGTDHGHVGAYIHSGWSGSLKNSIIDLNNGHYASNGIIYNSVYGGPEVADIHGDNFIGTFDFGEPYLVNNTIIAEPTHSDGIFISNRIGSMEEHFEAPNQISLINNLIDGDLHVTLDKDATIFHNFYGNSFYSGSEILLHQPYDFQGGDVAPVSWKPAHTLFSNAGSSTKQDEFYQYLNGPNENGNSALDNFIFYTTISIEVPRTENGEVYLGAIHEGDNWLKGATWTESLISLIGTNSDDIIDGKPYDFIDANDGDDDIIFDIDEQLSPFEIISAIGGDGNDTFIINHNYPTNILTNPFSADITEQFFLDGGAGIDIVFMNSENSQTQNYENYSFDFNPVDQTLSLTANSLVGEEFTGDPYTTFQLNNIEGILFDDQLVVINNDIINVESQLFGKDEYNYSYNVGDPNNTSQGIYSDYLFSTSDNNLIFGSDEDDTANDNTFSISDSVINLYGGNDFLISGTGNKTVLLGAGNDIAFMAQGGVVTDVISENFLIDLTSAYSSNGLDPNSTSEGGNLLVSGVLASRPSEPGTIVLRLNINSDDGNISQLQFQFHLDDNGNPTGGAGPNFFLPSQGEGAFGVFLINEVSEGNFLFNLAILPFDPLTGALDTDLPSGEWEVLPLIYNSNDTEFLSAADEENLKINVYNSQSEPGSASLIQNSASIAEYIYDSTNSNIDGNSGTDNVILIGDKNDYEISDLETSEHGKIEQLITHTKSGSTFKLKNIEEVGFLTDKIRYLDDQSSSSPNDQTFADYNIVETGEGDDLVIGGDNSDYIDTQGGADNVFAGGGEDFISLTGNSGDGTVKVNAGLGDDVISVNGFTGQAELTGGGGNDRLEIYGNYNDINTSGSDLIINTDNASIKLKDQLSQNEFGTPVYNENVGIGLITTLDQDDAGNIVETTVSLNPNQQADIGLVFLSDQDDNFTIPENSQNLFQISGFNGNDEIFGGNLNDTIYGGQGNDDLGGNLGDDILYGGEGNDLLEGGKGNDRLEGGNDNDTYLFDLRDGPNVSLGHDIINETSGNNDSILLLGLSDIHEITGTINSQGNLQLNFDDNLDGNSTKIEDFFLNEGSDTVEKIILIESDELQRFDNKYDEIDLLGEGNVLDRTIEWAETEGFAKTYYLDPDSIVAPEDQLNYILFSNPQNYSFEDGFKTIFSDQSDTSQIFVSEDENGVYYWTSNETDTPLELSYQSSLVLGGQGDDIIHGSTDIFNPITYSFLPSNPYLTDFLVGNAGDDTINTYAGFNIVFGGTGADEIYVGNGSYNLISGDLVTKHSFEVAEGQDDSGWFQSVNESYGDVVYFDFNIAEAEILEISNPQENFNYHFGGNGYQINGPITDLGDGVLSSSISIVTGIEKLVFNDAEISLVQGQPIVASDWLDQDLASNFESLDANQVNFKISGDTINMYYQSVSGDEISLLWSGSRYEVDYFSMPNGNDVNVVNWQNLNPITQSFTDFNSQTTDGRDIIFGTDESDYIDGKGGDDIILGGGGDDVLVGGSGNDFISGGSGKDTISGDVSTQIVNDLFADNNYALTSNDEINLTFGDDTLIGGDDKDIISAGEGNDTSITDQPDFNFDGTVDESELSILGEVLEDDEWL